MAKLLALEWDSREARIAVAQTRGKDILLEEAFTVDLAPAGGSGQLEQSEVGTRIAAALAARNVGRPDTLVAIGRANIELRQMTLPPCPPEELPDLVRFQAMRQFTTITAEWLLDYVPLQSTAEGASVLAAAISPEIVEQTQATCQASEVTAKRLLLRPFAAASLLCRRDRGKNEPPRLMVDLLADEADLTVLVDQHVVLMRTVRLPAADTGETSDDAGTPRNRSLLGEIRRTVAAAQNQTGGQRIEKVIVCGGGSDQASLQAYIEQELSYQVQLFDPFEQVRQGSRLKKQHPEHTGRFTPLIGMLVDEAAGDTHALDFLHPRKKPEAPSRTRRNSLIGVTAAIAAVAAGLLIWMQLGAQEDELALLTLKSNGLEDAVQRATEAKDDLAALEEFQDSDIVWLDELYDLCATVPPSDDIILSRLSFGTRNPSGGSIAVTGLARQSAVIEEVREALRKGNRQVHSDGSRYEPRQKEYQWHFRETVLVKPHSEANSEAAADDAPAQPDDAAQSDGTVPVSKTDE